MYLDRMGWKFAVAAMLSCGLALASGPAISTASLTLPVGPISSVPRAEALTHATGLEPLVTAPSLPMEAVQPALDQVIPPAVSPAVVKPVAATFGEPFALGRADPEGLLYTPQWAVMEGKIAADRAVLSACRTEPSRCPESARRLEAIAAAGRALTGRRRLAEVNRAVNLAVAYTSDRRQYGRDNVWAAPLATFASGRGDCKDYATAKYLALLEAGVPESDLRVVVVRQAKPSEPLHAVLTVRQGGEWLVLDNRRMALLSSAEVRDYRALVAFRDTRLDLRPTLAATDVAAAGSSS